MNKFTGLDIVAWDAAEELAQTKEAEDVMMEACGTITDEIRANFVNNAVRSIKNTLAIITSTPFVLAHMAQDEGRISDDNGRNE